MGYLILYLKPEEIINEVSDGIQFMFEG